jgi:hypothetical protein
MEYLRTEFMARGLALNCDIRWPVRSPGLTPMDFYFWARLKSPVFDRIINEPLGTVQQLENWIREAIALISPQEIWNATRSVPRRVDLCIANQGNTFEHLL